MSRLPADGFVSQSVSVGLEKVLLLVCASLVASWLVFCVLQTPLYFSLLDPPAHILNPSLPPSLPLTAAVSLLPFSPFTHASRMYFGYLPNLFSRPLGFITDRRASWGWDSRPSCLLYSAAPKCGFSSPAWVLGSGNGFLSIARLGSRPVGSREECFLHQESKNILGTKGEGRHLELLCFYLQPP